MHIDERLAVSCGEELLPTFGRRVGRFSHIVTPFGDVVVAYGLFFLFFVGNGKDEMHIGVHEGGHLSTRRTFSAGIIFSPVRALYVACIGKSERQSPGSVVPFEQLGVCNVSVFYRLDEAAFYIVLSDYVFEKHRIFFLIVFSIYCLFPCHSEPRPMVECEESPFFSSVEILPPCSRQNDIVL